MGSDEYELLCHPALLRKVLKEGLNIGALTQLVQHVCYGITETSTPVVHCVLQARRADAART